MIHYHIFIVIFTLAGQPSELVHPVINTAYTDFQTCDAAGPTQVALIQQWINTTSDLRFRGKFKAGMGKCFSDDEVDRIRQRWPLLLPTDIQLTERRA